MPVISSLATTGMTFDNVWATPVCAPTRATILTSKYGFRNGVTAVTGGNNILSSDQVTIHDYLTQNTPEYNHAVVGKWHVSGNGNNALS